MILGCSFQPVRNTSQQWLIFARSGKTIHRWPTYSQSFQNFNSDCARLASAKGVLPHRKVVPQRLGNLESGVLRRAVGCG
jgi:hypothetical protein